MRIDLPAGTYVVAVSGGVDSVALLHLLMNQSAGSPVSLSAGKNEPAHQHTSPPAHQPTSSPAHHYIVAHLDHGIREDSAVDRRLVQRLAKSYGLPFVYHQSELGPGTSEAAARRARYAFLHQVRRASGAQAIITAHHQDDVLETIILNLLRGTGRKGLHALKSSAELYRPLIHVSKADLTAYARVNRLEWHEDSTNADEAYLRNYVRHRLLPRFQAADRRRLLELSERTALLDQVISEQLSNYLHAQPALQQLDRNVFLQLPHIVAREVLAEWLRQRTRTELSGRLLERLVIAAKTGETGAKIDVDADAWLEIGPDVLALTSRER